MSRTISTSLHQAIQASSPLLSRPSSTSCKFLTSTPRTRLLLLSTRPLSTTASHPQKKHRTMHPDPSRSSINTERSEYTNSGTDNEVASQHSAFDPTNIDPDMEAEASGMEVLQDGNEGNPLEVSPANREVSRAFDPMEGGAQRGVDRGPSLRFSPKKGTKVSMGGWAHGGARTGTETGAAGGKGGGGEGTGNGSDSASRSSTGSAS